MEVVKKTRKNTMEQLKEENAAAGRFVPGMHSGPCQEAWAKGLRHYVDGWWRTPDGWKFVTRFFPVFVKKNPDTKKSFNCDVKNEGGQYVLATLPGRDKLQTYLKSIPIWKDLQSLPDGLYTWIFYTRAASPVQFAATKTWSALEMGTTHLAIAARVEASAVHGAGELRKSGNRYVYNLLSGTFTGDWKKKIGGKGTCTADGLEKYIDEEFRSRFGGFDLSKTGTTLIAADLPVTEGEIDTYTKAGWTFSFYPTQKECLDVMATKTGGRRHTRRGGGDESGMVDPKQVLRGKLIQGVQKKRLAELEAKHAEIDTKFGNYRDPKVRQALSDARKEVFKLAQEHQRLLARGKGRTVRQKLGMSEAQRILQAKQIAKIQAEREAEILKLVAAITGPKNRERPGWEGPSEAKQQHLAELLHENDRLLAKGKGRRTTRRS